MTKKVTRLTARELEILKLIYSGFTDDQIAGALCISCNTVRTHRQNLRAKLDANKTTAMIRNALDQKLL